MVGIPQYYGIQTIYRDAVDETTFRILDILASQLTRPISIYELTKQIKARYQKADYKNIYTKTQQLAKQGLLSIQPMGQAKATQLNLGHYLLFDLLVEMENKKKKKFFEEKKPLQEFASEMDFQFQQQKRGSFREWILMANPKKNSGLNRIELLFFLSDQHPANNEEKNFENEANSIRATIGYLERKFNFKTDCLILSESEFEEILFTNEKNVLGEMLSDKIMLENPPAFWKQIKNSLSKKPVTIQYGDFRPNKITETELAYNLYRFGYKELGPKIEPTSLLSIELTIATILFRKDARKTEAIPVLLEKAFQKPVSRKPNYSMLLFLAKKYGETEKLMGLLEAYQAIKPRLETKKALQTLKELGIKPKKIESKIIKQKMGLYNAN